MKALNFVSIFSVFITTCYSQAPTIEIWDKHFGGTNNDDFFSFHQTNDRGIILGGQSESPVSGNKTQDCRGGYDYWAVKLDSSSNKQWDARFGTSSDDLLWAVQQTFDGGYILSGFTTSDTGYDKTSLGWGGDDFWLVKTDAAGNKLWDKDYGGTDDEYLYTMQQTKDGGYILGGDSWSGVGGDKTQPNWDATLSTPDYWVIKTDSVGNKQWDKRFGGTNIDQLLALVQTNDGGYILGGTTESDSGGDISQPPWSWIDYWVIKINSVGNKQWDKRFGGTSETGSELYSLIQTTDGGYLLGGYSTSDSGGTKTQNLFGEYDYWIIKIDSVGNKQWDSDYGGSGYNLVTNVAQTSDNGYLISGTSSSNASGDKSQNNLGGGQVWLVKTDSDENKEWDKTILVGGDNNNGYAIQIDANCYVIAQQTPSGIAGYKTQANWDTSDSTDDLWIVKFCFTGIGEGIEALTNNLQFNVYPNPFSNELDITIAQQNLQQATFTITNLLGQPVYTQTETNLSPAYTKMLDLSYLPNGIYFVEVVVDGEKVVREVVKE